MFSEAMETKMELSDGEQTNADARVVLSQYSTPPPPVSNMSSLLALYGNSPIGLEKGIERRVDHEQLPGYIFMCNGKTKLDCFRYRVFGIPRGRKDTVESIKPGMKLFLYDFEKKLLYGVYEATIGGRLDIEPEAFEKKYPAQVGFRIVKNCYPLPEKTFKSAIHENYNGLKFKQELAPHQVMSLLSLFRSFTAPELDLMPQRLASRASGPMALTFEERLIAATQLRNASSVLDPLSARHAEPRLGSLMAHQSVNRTSLLQPNYIRPENFSTPAREALSLSNLNQPYIPTESQQQRLPGDPTRSSIQDPQLKYLTILSNIRRYGSAPERSASENEYYPETPSEKDQLTSPYSDKKRYPSTLSENEHPSASAANGNMYKSDFYNLASQKEGETSQQHAIPGGTMQSDMQAVSVAHSRTETAGYHTPAHNEAIGNASERVAEAIGYIHQPQSLAVNYPTHSQPGSVEESAHSYAGTVSYAQQQYYATQHYAGATGYAQQPHEIGYAQQPHEIGYAQQPDAAATAYAQQQHEGWYAQQSHAAATGYAQQPEGATAAYTQEPHAAASGYTQQPHAAATGYAQQSHATATSYTQQLQAAATAYAQQSHAGATGYAQQPHATPTGYAQQPHATPTGYTQQQSAGVTGYALQTHAAAAGYALQPHTQTVGYTPQYHAQVVGYTPQAVTEGSIPRVPGTYDWNATSQTYSAPGDWNAVNQSYYPHIADATTTYNQTS